MRFVLLSSEIGASQNLFSETWTEGNLYEIQPIVSALGTFACWMISIVGFGIVIFSILKNAMSGLYVVNPNFWDKVDAIKDQAKNGAGNLSNSGNVATQKLGGILTFLLGFIPNIRALTDFDDGVPVDKKQYFMKSIPLLIAQIFIGMLIFFGYPAKIANWIGTGATYAIGAVINNIDPVQVVLNASDAFTTYKLSTDGSQDPWEQNINKMASEMTSVVHTTYNDMLSDPTQECAYQIEAILLQAFDTAAAKDVLGASEGYNYDVSCTFQKSTPTVSSSYQNIENGVWQARATNGTYSFKFWISGESLPTGSTKVTAEDHFVWTITATPKAVSNVSSASFIPCGSISKSATIMATTSTARLSITGLTFGSGESDVKGVLGKTVTIELIDPSSQSAVATVTGKVESSSVTVSEGSSAYVQMSKADWGKLQDAISKNPSAYVRILLSGSASYVLHDSATGSSTTMKVSEMRLAVGGGVSHKCLLSNWTDVTLGTLPSEGVSPDYNILKKSTKK